MGLWLMDAFSFGLGFATCLLIVFVYSVGRHAERIAMKKRWTDGEHAP